MILWSNGMDLSLARGFRKPPVAAIGLK